MRTVFFGTPEFAVPTLQRLIESPHPPLAVVSQPDRRRGRGRRSAVTPVAQCARAAGIEVLQPESAGDPIFQERLRALEPDIGVVVAFGQFLPRAVRELPRRGYLLNGHASLLPRHRGAAPIAHAILAGDSHTGVSIMKIVREMDAGPVALARSLEIGPDENAGDLAARLAELAAELLGEALDILAAGELVFEEQDAGHATAAPKIGPEDAHIDWSRSAETIVRQVRAMAPKPGAVTELGDDRLRILEAVSEPGDVGDAGATPGLVSRRGDDGALRIATGQGWLLPRSVQRAGGRALAIDAFLRGREIPNGTKLGGAGGPGQDR
jgi:methionyl-tRNA formyltransferase